MPAPFTSSFASAAAGNTSNDGSNGRNTGSGDWSRARTNGVTQTFRRSSTANSLSQQRDTHQTSANAQPSGGSVYVPPHLNSNNQSAYSRNGGSETRYSKDQLLDLFRDQRKNGFNSSNVEDQFMDGWTPAVNGSVNGGWGRRDDHKDAAGPELCWDSNGSVQPLALLEMTEEEKEAFASSVNSPLKHPTQNTNKDGTPNNGPVNRRTSISQNQNNNSPSTRPGAQRRESGGDLLQSSHSVTSPTSNNRFSREESSISSPPPSLLRRKTDFKDGFATNPEDKDENTAPTPFGTLRRTSTNPVSAGLNGPSSPWSGAPPSAGFSPMGAFGSFALGGPTPTSTEKKSGLGSVRGESRFRNLMNAGSSEDIGSRVKEKASINSLEKLTESNEQPQSRWSGDRTSQRYSANRDLYTDDEIYQAGSAALGGGDDASPPFPQNIGYRHPDRQTSYDDIGFASLGMPSETAPFRELMQRRDFSQQQQSQAQNRLSQPNEPMSPTDTNPFSSPPHESAMPADVEHDGSDLHNMQYGVQYGHNPRGFPPHYETPAGDRSQTSSTGPSRAFPHLGNLSNLSGLGSGAWSAAPGAIGTPSRTQPGYAGFGEQGYGGLDGLTSPQSAQAGSNFFGAPGSRLSKPSSLLPAHVQEQARQGQGFGEGDHQWSGSTLREPDNTLRPQRSGMEDLFNTADRDRGMHNIASPFTTNETGQPTSSQGPNVPPNQTSSSNQTGRPREPETPSTQMPATQQRTMVMPDRMRWIYRDPTGNMQGPWSGLEMHDWYKAGFFSPELQVKKLEDADYEPLAQLIRRIGNSREPFLVPQIGIPHGPSTAPPPTSAATAAAVPATTPSTAQPPFASSFPSFGTTLSAEQQNALERRKQEEQYLMARQKEHLAQQQVILKQQMHMQGGGQLHHHSSAHSLQSQPSYGSITSPTNYQPMPAQGPIQPPAPSQGFFDGATPRAGAPLGAGIDPLSSVREEDLPGFMERLGMGRGGQLPFNQEGQVHHQQVAAIMQERARQEREQQQFMQQRGDDDQRVTAERLEQYYRLRAQEEQLQQQQQQQQRPISNHVHHEKSDRDLAEQQRQGMGMEYQEPPQKMPNEHKPEPLSLSEQVQKAAAKQPSTQPQSPWAKVDSGLPQPFPPPQSQSPMPAPTPQRNRQSVAEALNAESQSPSQASSAETPSAAMAPWAKERDESSKGPSLKEIQAMEAKKAAQQEEIAAAARRAAAEQERLNQHNQAPAPAPGLPSSANWASSISPAVPTTSGPSPWAKPAAGKPAVATPVTGSKKTLAQIQKEEENKKNRQAAAQAAAAANLVSTATPAAGGKRYADLASKPTNLTPQTSNAAWTTVGASGKVKTPTTPAPGLTVRTSSTGVAPPSATATATRPKLAAGPASKGPGSQQHANEAFQKWAKGVMGKGLNSGLLVDNFVNELLSLPPDVEIIADSIYGASQTLDGRRIAEEYAKRRKLADRGIIPDTSNAPGFSSPNHVNENKSGGGWSEVAKKGPQAPKEESNAAFKVVGGKKKGGKR